MVFTHTTGDSKSNKTHASTALYAHCTFQQRQENKLYIITQSNSQFASIKSK